MLVRELKQLVDHRATADSGRFGYGFHDTQLAWSYRPAFEQDRNTVHGLLALIARRGLCGTIVQIGLGLNGGGHFLFSMVARRVVTIEIDEARVANFCERNEYVPERDHFVVGDSGDTSVLAHVRALASGCDLLLIDGGESYAQVRRDWELYAPLVREGGIVAIVDSSQAFPASSDRFDVDRFVFDLDREVLVPLGVGLGRIGRDRVVCYYEQTEASASAVPPRRPASFVAASESLLLGGSVHGFECVQRDDRFWAVRESDPPFEPKRAARSEYAIVLCADSREELEGLIEDYCEVLPELERARALIRGRQWAEAARLTAPMEEAFGKLRVRLRPSIEAYPQSCELLTELGTIALLCGRAREGAALLRRALEQMVTDRDLVQLLSQVYLSVLEDPDAARGLLLRMRERVRRIRLQEICENDLSGNVLWTYPRLLADVYGVIQVGAHIGEEVDAFNRLEIGRQLYIEANPAVFADLGRACECATDSARIATLNAALAAQPGRRELRVGADSRNASLLRGRSDQSDDHEVTEVEATTLDQLVADGAIDPRDYNLLFVDVEGAELEVLRGAEQLLAHIDVVCVAVFYESHYDEAPLPEEIRHYLAGLDSGGFLLRAHEPGADPTRGDAVFWRERPRRS